MTLGTTRLGSYDIRNVYATGVTAALLLGGCQCLLHAWINALPALKVSN